MAAQVTGKSDRLGVLDAMRGFALCGILVINLPSMGWLVNSHAPVRGVMDGGLSTGLWWVQMLFVNGTMRGLFSLLFGASLLLFLAKAERGDATPGEAGRLMRRRLSWLFVFGVIDMTLLLWPGDILNIYAMAGLLVLPFTVGKPRTLLIAATTVIAALSLFMVVQELPNRDILANGPALEAKAMAHSSLSANERDQLEEWMGWRTGQMTTGEEIATEREARLGGYGDNLSYLSRISWDWFSDWKDTVRWVIDAAAFMLVGMLLFRLRWLQGEASSRNYLLMALCGYGLGLPLKAIEATRDWHLMMGVEHPDFSMFWLPALTFQPARLLVTLGHAALFLWCWKVFSLRLAPLQALGRMAFTGYLLQSLLAAIAFSGFGLALWGSLSLGQLWLVAAMICGIEIVFALVWLARFPMGPMEWIWRTLTYGSPPTAPRAVSIR